MKGSTFSSVIIDSNRIDELAVFYQKGLQLDPPVARGDDHIGFQIGSLYFGFDKLSRQPEGSPGSISVWFEVEDLINTFYRFIGLGVVVKYPPMEKAWGAIQAAVYDLDGNVVGLIQRQEP